MNRKAVNDLPDDLPDDGNYGVNHDGNHDINHDVNQIYDKIFKRILTLSGGAVIRFINAVFNKDFPPDSEIIYHWTENIKDDLEKTIADTIITIIPTGKADGKDDDKITAKDDDKITAKDDGKATGKADGKITDRSDAKADDTSTGKAEKFHIEVQIGNDSTIVLRVFDYGYQDALKYRSAGSDRITLTFPQPKIIFLEHNSNTPDVVTLELEFPGQGQFEYHVSAMKFLTYSIEELNRQHMVILMPLYLLKLRREIERSRGKGRVRENAAALKELMNEGILKAIEENGKAGNITSYDAFTLTRLLSRLYDYLYGNIEEFRDEGVKSMLSDKLILEYEVEIAEQVKEKVAEQVKEKVAENTKRLTLAYEAEMAEKVAEVAKRLLAKGMPLEDIADITTLPTNKIRELQAQ